MADEDLADTSAPDIDAARFREVMGHFPTGVTVVTTLDGDAPVGFTAQSFLSLSLDPPLVAVCPGRTSASLPKILSAGVFCVNILTEEQEAVSRVFATKEPDKFRGVGWRTAATGAPVLQDCLAWVDCRVEAEHEAGDHVIVVGRVVDLDVDGEGGPLLFYRGGYGTFSP